MIDHDDIRVRLRKRFDDLGLSLTGKWLKENGIGQTTVRNFLDGSNNSLTVETLSKLSKPLKISERWMLFGNESNVSEELLAEMAELAADEIQPGLSISQIRNAVSSALREQLRLHLSVGAVQDNGGEATAPDTIAQSPAPTKPSGKGGSRNS